jgi:aminopeptidase N
MLNLRLISSCALALALAATSPLLAQRGASKAGVATISSPTSYEPQPFDVLHYEAFVDLQDAPAPTMRGMCNIRLRWVGAPTEPFYFHLRTLHVDSVFYDHVATSAAAVGDSTSATYHYEVMPPPAARQGDTATVTVYYHGTMTDELGDAAWGGVSSTGGTLFAMGVGFLNNYVSATEHWLPCYDHPSDKATFEGTFHVKSGMTVASNGTMQVTNAADGSLIYYWHTDIPTATYLLTFAVDNYVPLDFPGQTPPMVIYSRPADSAATRVTF